MSVPLPWKQENDKNETNRRCKKFIIIRKFKLFCDLQYFRKKRTDSIMIYLSNII
jgi:hypothetical protein